MRITKADRQLYSGMIICLIIVLDYGEDSIADEILKNAGDLDIIRQIAVEEGDEQVVKAVDNFRKWN